MDNQDVNAHNVVLLYETCCRKKDHPILRFQPSFAVPNLFNRVPYILIQKYLTKTS